MVAQLSLTLGDPMDYSLPGSSVYGILQARILEEWVAISFIYIYIYIYIYIHTYIYIFIFIYPYI